MRIGFDVDGVLADFAGAFREVEVRLFGPASALAAEPPEAEADRDERNAAAGPPVRPPHDLRRRRDAVWTAIRDTNDFWTTLKPVDEAAIPRLQQLAIRGGWEVIFLTHRPVTRGDCVQRQTQRWLRDRGFDLPSVLVVGGSRAPAAAALRLGSVVDDSAQTCLDVASGSNARPILIAAERDALTENSARRLRIDVAGSIGEALDLLAASAPSAPLLSS